MKPKDLFIGAWVQPKNVNAPFQVCSVDSDGLYDTGDTLWCSDEIEPIPITPEILEKNGFSRIDIEDNIKQSETGGFYVWYEIESNILGIEENTSTYEGESAKTLMTLRILNVHELQAAMRLCGMEEEIIL